MTLILLAEDDIDDQELLIDTFSQIDPTIQLEAFTTGKKILKYLEDLSENSLPSLIILDYNIPEMNGAEILKQLETSRYHEIVKLVWSTSDSPMYKNTCLSLGAAAYFVKPSNISGLMEMARRMLSYVN